MLRGYSSPFGGVRAPPFRHIWLQGSLNSGEEMTWSPFKTPFWSTATVVIYLYSYILAKVQYQIPVFEWVVSATRPWPLFCDPQAEKSSITFAQFERCTMLTMSVNITQCAQHNTHAQVSREPGFTGLQDRATQWCVILQLWCHQSNISIDRDLVKKRDKKTL